jgi:hypothetical protein
VPSLIVAGQPQERLRLDEDSSGEDGFQRISNPVSPTLGDGVMMRQPGLTSAAGGVRSKS